MSHRKRSRLFVDGKVQGVLVFRAGLYWCYCLLTVMTMLFSWRVLVDRPASSAEMFQDATRLYLPALAASLLLLPLVLIDVIRLSHRFAGPMVRLRRAMRDVANGQHTNEVHLRDHDYWSDFSQDFNRMLQQVQGQTSESSSEAIEPQEETLRQRPSVVA